MSTDPNRRYRIANAAVDLALRLEPAVAADLDRHLAGFVASGPDESSIRVEQLDEAPSEASLEPGSFRVDVTEVAAGRDEIPSVRAVWLTAAPNTVIVRGRFLRSMHVVGAIHLGLAHWLPQRCGLLLHASVVRAGGEAFVFAGPSGAGKSSAAAGFDGGDCVGDERVAVRRTATGWCAYSVPMWGGKYGPVSSVALPVAMVVVMRKSAPLGVQLLPQVARVERLVPAVVHNHYDAKAADRVLAALVRLAEEVPVVELAWTLATRFGAELRQFAFSSGRSRRFGAK